MVASNQANVLKVTKRGMFPRTLHSSRMSEQERSPQGTAAPPALPFNDKLDVVARLQDLLQLGNPKAVGAAQQDALRQAHDKQVLGIHQELGVRNFDWLRYSYGFRCMGTEPR